MPAPILGSLYLLPMPLGTGAAARAAVPPGVAARLAQLRHVAAEGPRRAAALIAPLLKDHGHAEALAALSRDEYTFYEISEHSLDLDGPLKLLHAGTDVGLISEAGYPAIADPGAELVSAAHALGCRVEVLTGPSSLMLALAASGLGGQLFAFHGYLPRKAAERTQAILRLEAESQRTGQTQLCIEAPYRNAELLDALLAALSPSTLLCVACDLTLPTALVTTLSVRDWHTQPRPDLHKRPTVFLWRG